MKTKKRRKRDTEPKVHAVTGTPTWWIPIIACLLVIAAYANGVKGEFVYDDSKQIVQNHLIQDSRYFWKALSEDVWAFKGEREEAWSNYWRPAFIAWLMLNFRLFGLNPAGWHVMNLALHAGVCVLLCRILGRLNVRPGVQAAVIWLFAVHPAHVESVSWISGSTDLLLGIFLAGSLDCFLKARTNGERAWLAYVCYALALFSKESAVLFPAIIFVCCSTFFRDLRSRALQETLPFAAMALIFLILRAMVLHGVSQVSPWAPDYLSTILTIPMLIAFYLYIAVFPVSLGPSYGIRAVTPSNLGFTNFVLPLAVLVLLAYLARKWITKKEDGPAAAIGLSLFCFLLLPALYIRAFLPDQIAHDRYLYLPLFGILLFLLSAIPKSIPMRAVTASSLVLCVPLIFLTVRYNRAYHDELAFWKHAVTTDPHSATTWSSYGNLLRVQPQLPEARKALENALHIDPDNTLAVYGLAMVNVSEGRMNEAEAGFNRIIKVLPDHESATDQLAALYEKENRLPELTALLQQARKHMPYLKVKYTRNLAFAYYRSNRIDEAVSELESIRNELRIEADPKNLECWFYLADLYRIQGRNAEAVQAAENYLAATKGLDPQAARLKGEAEKLIRSLKS